MAQELGSYGIDPYAEGLTDEQYTTAMAELANRRQVLLAGKEPEEQRRIHAMRNNMLWHLQNVSVVLCPCWFCCLMLAVVSMSLKLAGCHLQRHAQDDMQRLQIMSFLAKLVTVVEMQQCLQQTRSSICSRTVPHSTVRLCTELYCIAVYYTLLSLSSDCCPDAMLPDCDIAPSLVHRLTVWRHSLPNHLYSSASSHTVVAVAKNDHDCRWVAGHKGPAGCCLGARPQAAL